jgi:hypothetical protein
MQANTTRGPRLQAGHRTVVSQFSIGSLIVLLALTVFSIPARAQYAASLQGTVADPTGAVIPDATVTLTDKETNRNLTAQSNGSGTYTIGGLQPSTYKVTVTRTGFKNKLVDNVRILANQPNSLNVTLEVGTTNAETVTVNAETQPVIDTATGQLGSTISQNQIGNLPSYGRDVYQLVQLAPGMFGDQSQAGGGGTNNLPGNQGPGGSSATSGIFSTENRPQAFASGGRNDTNNITLDGVGVTSVTWGGAAVITPNEDSVKEVKIVANSYDAEWGRTSGAQIQVTSQNGTNSFHGSAFIQGERPGLNAYQRWDPNNNPQRNNSRFNQIGGSLGGPIIHNKLFAFFAYETIRNNSVTTGGGWYETPQFDKYAGAAPIASQYLTLPGAGAAYTNILEGSSDPHQCADIGLVQGVNCNFIQGQGLDIGSPLTIGVGHPDPSFKPAAGSAYTPGLGGNGTGSPANLDGVPDIMFVATRGPSNQVNEQYNGRLDFQATGRDLIAYSIYWVPVTQTSFNGPSRPSNFFHHNATNYSTGLMWDHTFSPSVLNQARADMAGWKWNELTANPQTPFGLPVDQIFSVNSQPTFSSISGTGTGDLAQFGPNVGSVFDQWTLNIRDTVTKVAGAHNMRFGGEATRLAYLDEPTWNGQPTYYFNNLWDFLNDAPTAENATVDPQTGIPSSFRKDDREQLWAAYFQDDWKVRPNLTINLGLRYEYFGGMTEKNGHLANLRLGSGPNTLTGIHFQLGGSEFNPSKFNFGPQVGFAWTMPHDPRLVLRGGFGLGYTAMEMAITTNTRNNPPYLAQNSTLTGSQVVYGTGSNIYQYGNLPANPNLITTFGPDNLPTANVQLNVTGLPGDLPTARLARYSLEAQYDMGHRWIATIGYDGSTGRHLPLQYNLNNKLAPAVLAGQIAYNPKLSFVDWYEDSGVSNFNALQTELQHQFANHYEIDIQYRWAKSLDNGSGPYTLPDYQFLPGSNWGPSDYDVRNMFKVWGQWSPVLFRGNHGFLEKVAGGWTFSGIVNVHSGFPFNPVYNDACAFTSTSGECSYRPAEYLHHVLQSQSTDTFKQPRGYFSNPDPTYYFDIPAQPVGTAWPTDGTAPAPGALPTAPGIRRNAFFGPRYFSTDVTGVKAFGLPKMRVLGEGARLELRANAYNLFNQLNLYAPVNTITDPHFGRAGSVLSGRTVELEAHFKF